MSFPAFTVAVAPYTRQPRDEMQIAFAKPIDPRHDGVDAAR
ncbi:Uncharacterised protein [Pandoraea pulmonicola]|uniref:Uncharacterized protein n=1 Tax=Pandoraea pulmonicola TaxID=93221 RepID=A0AAJ4ZEW3_PANPU|nr:Uncharacterised protein [Pandoraea pulmonicola]